MSLATHASLVANALSIVTLRGRRYLDERTNTAAALRYMTDTMFSAGNGDRSGIPNVAIVITDGVPNVPSEDEVTASGQQYWGDLAGTVAEGGTELA